MAHKSKYIVGFFIIVAALGYLFLTSFRSSLQYYVTVDEALTQRDKYEDVVLKIAGKASHITRIETSDRLHHQFLIDGTLGSIQAFYTGLVPDTFKDGADVVATGTFDEKGNFITTHLLAKCASKYQAKLPEEKKEY